MPEWVREPETGTGVRCRSYPFCSLEDRAMRSCDFSPLWRSTIGFDRLSDLVETAQRAGEKPRRMATHSAASSNAHLQGKAA